MSEEKHPRFQQLMDEAYDLWEDGWSKARFHAELDPAHCFAVHFGNLNYQVENGGFSQWGPCNRYGTETVATWLVLQCAMIGTENSDRLGKMLGKYCSIMKDDFDFGSDPDYEEFEELDTEYYEFNAALMDDLEAYINKKWPLKPLEVEIRSLKEENERLKEENAKLKKEVEDQLVIFAQIFPAEVG